MRHSRIRRGGTGLGQQLRTAPERRSLTDIAICIALVLVLITGGVAVWWFSPVRATTSTPAQESVAEVAPAGSVPDGLVQLWQERSEATLSPAVTDSLIVTADGGRVVGREPVSGRPVWSYERDLPLCAVAAAWPGSADKVMTVYRNSRGCGEVTALAADSGIRAGGRSSDADEHIRLSTDSRYALAQGDTRLETWGSNLVRGIEYGRVDAPVKPDVQPGRTDCRIFSAAGGGDRVAVIERCEADVGYRLTVLGATLDSEEKVRQYGSTLITRSATGPAPTMISMSANAIAVYDGGADPPEPEPSVDGAPATPDAPRRASIRQFDIDGVSTSTNWVNGPVQAPARSEAIIDSGLLTFWTGRATIVLDAASLRPIYQVPGTLGPGQLMAGLLLLPSPAGISVRDSTDGRELRTLAVTRDGYDPGPDPDSDAALVSLRVLGDVIVEQRGSHVTAYGPR